MDASLLMLIGNLKLQDWASMSTIAASVAVIVTTLFAWRQIRLQSQHTSNDQRRFIRESIAIVNETLHDSEFRNARRVFFNSASNKTYRQLIDADKDYARIILSVYGKIAHMIGRDALDKSVFFDFWESTLDRDMRRLITFIEGERKSASNNLLFVTTDELWKSNAKGNNSVK